MECKKEEKEIMSSTYITVDELTENRQELIEKISNVSEANKSLLLDFISCGGADEDVLIFFTEHDLERKEYFEIIRPLVSTNAALEWYKVVFYAIENKEKASMIYWISNIVDFYMADISCEKTLNAIKGCTKIHQMAKVKKELLGVDEDETKKIEELLEGVQTVVSVMEREEKSKIEHIAKLEGKVISLEKQVSEKDAEIDQLKQSYGSSENLQMEKELDFYKVSYENQLASNTKLKEKLAETQFEVSKLQRNSKKTTSMNEFGMGYMKELFDKMNGLEKEVRELRKSQLNDEVPESLLKFITTNFNEQNKEIKSILDEKLENALAVSEQEVKKEEKPKEGITERSENTEKMDEPEEIPQENKIEDKQEDEKKVVSETPPELKTEKKIVSAPSSKDEKTEAINFFQTKKKKRMEKAFSNVKDEKEKTSIIMAQSLKRGYAKDTMKSIKMALKTGELTSDFIYSMTIDEKITEEEMLEVIS